MLSLVNLKKIQTCKNRNTRESIYQVCGKTASIKTNV